MATRSSSACVALKSMRFIRLFSRAAHGQDEARHPLNCGDLVWRYRDCPSSGNQTKTGGGFRLLNPEPRTRWGLRRAGCVAWSRGGRPGPHYLGTERSRRDLGPAAWSLRGPRFQGRFLRVRWCAIGTSLLSNTVPSPFLSGDGPSCGFSGAGYTRWMGWMWRQVRPRLSSALESLGASADRVLNLRTTPDEACATQQNRKTAKQYISKDGLE